MNIYLTQLGEFLLAQSWQLALLIFIVALATLLLRNKSAHVRYILWLIVLAKCLVPPLYSIPLHVLPSTAPNWELSETPFHERSGPLTAKPIRGSSNSTVLKPSQAIIPEADPPVAEQTTLVNLHALTWTEIYYRLGLIWLVGLFIYLTFNSLRVLRTHSWLRRTRISLPPANHQDFAKFFSVHGFRSLPKIWLAKDVSQPFVWGLVKGSIYLPSNFIHINTPAQQRNILAHELSHIVRFDAAVNLLQLIAQSVFWFHPLVWWTNIRIRREREKCCDEMVVAGFGGRPREYSMAILEALLTPRESTRHVPSLAIVGPARNLEERIKTMMKPGKRFYRCPSVVVALIVLTLALITVPTALVLTVRAATEMEMVPPHRAADAGEIAEVEQWLALGGDVNVKNVAGETLLRVAILGGRLDIVHLLEKHGADIDAEIQNDPLLIELVATKGYPAVCDYLISRGADTSHICLAAYLGKLDQVKEYIESDSQQVSASDKQSILQGAITGGHADIIEYILDHGADIKQGGVLGIAVRANRKQILELLIAKGADPNPGGSWSPLHLTLWYYPRLEMAKALLSHGADPYKEKGENAWNPMHYAIDNEKKDMVKLFLEHRHNTDLPPYAYYALKTKHKDVLPLFEPYVEISPIHLSCFYGKRDDIKSYLEQGNDIEAKDIGGLSLLQCAVLGSQMEIVDYLIAQGCNVNSKASDGKTALHCAANSKEMVQKLITAGALVEAKDNDDCTPFFYAHDLEAAQVLLKHGAEINIQRRSDGATALHEAAIRSPYRSMKRMAWLVAQGADVNRRNNDGSTPLGVAMNRDRLDAVKYLIEHGADINCHDEQGLTPLRHAARRGQKEIAQMLLEKDADITVLDSVGRTAIGLAKQYGHTEIVELLSKRARQLDPEKEIMTIFDYAAIGDTEKIKSLIATGQDVNTKSKSGATALHWASSFGHIETAELLIQNGANVNSQDNTNSALTPLQLACSSGNKAVAELLLANGADISVINNAGDTALDIASQRNYPEIVELLQKHGAK